MKSPRFSAEELALSAWKAELESDSAFEEADKVDKGFYVVKELVVKLSIPRQTLMARLKRLLSAGKAEEKSFRVWSGNGLKSVKHYRLKV